VLKFICGYLPGRRLPPSWPATDGRADQHGRPAPLEQKLDVVRLKGSRKPAQRRQARIGQAVLDRLDGAG